MLQFYGVEARHWCISGFKDVGDTEYQCGETRYPNYDYPHREQTIPGYYVPVIGMGAFIAVLCFSACRIMRQSNEWTLFGIVNQMEICVRMLLFSSGSTLFANSMIKLIVGRPRPNFYSLMATDDVLLHRAARRSFPSGHSAYSASMLYLLSLNLYAAVKYVQSQMMKGRKIQISMRNPHSFFFGHDYRCIWHRPGYCMALTFLPMALSVCIAISRITDFWHHLSDVVVGLLLGMAVAKATYRYFKAELEWKHVEEDEYEFMRI